MKSWTIERRAFRIRYRWITLFADVLCMFDPCRKPSSRGDIETKPERGLPGFVYTPISTPWLTEKLSS